MMATLSMLFFKLEIKSKKFKQLIKNEGYKNHALHYFHHLI